MTRAELLLDARAGIAESPVWDSEHRVLWWVDIPAGRVHRLDFDGGDSSLPVGQPVGAVAVRSRGGLVLAIADGFATLDPETGRVEPLSAVEADRDDSRMNDGKCDPRGRFWAGTVANDFRDGAGALYRLDASGEVTVQVSGITCSNGLDWSPDGATMYYADSVPGIVDAFDFEVETGSISGRRTLIDASPWPGNPDGLTVDAEGCLWVAMWDGWAVRRFQPDGRLIETIPIPVARVTSCAFGGDGLDELLVTTARDGLSDPELAAQPLAGALFRVATGALGRPAALFAG